MSQGTFLTDPHILDITKKRSSARPEDFSKPIQSLRVVLPTTREAPKAITQRDTTKSFPVIASTQRTVGRSQSVSKLGTREQAFRHTASNTNFRNPLFKKIDQVAHFYEDSKNKRDMSVNRRTATSAIFALKQRRESRQQSAPNLKPFSFADAYDQAIAKDMDDLYQSRKGFFGTDDFHNIPKRRFFNEEVEKDEKRSQKQMKTFNEIMFQIKSGEKKLEGLKQKLIDILNSFEDNTDLRIYRNNRVKALFKAINDLEVSESQNDQYQHVYERTKHDLKTLRSTAEEAKRDAEFAKVMINNENRGLLYSDFIIRKSITEMMEIKDHKEKGEDRINPNFEQHLYDEVSRFEDRRKLKQIKTHERNLEQELEDRKKRLEEEEAKIKEERLKAEEEKRANDMKKWKIKLHEYRERFRHFQKVTSVSTVTDLVPRLEELNTLIGSMNDDIAVQEDENDILKKEALQAFDEREHQKFSKLQTNTEQSDKDAFADEQDVDKLEVALLEKRDQNQKIEKEIRKLNDVIVNSCTSISRVMHQLNKGKPLENAVNSENSTKILSVCGLKLERMLTMVVKKKKNFYMESINTDATIKEGSENYPPPYMGINYKSNIKQVREDYSDVDEEDEEEFNQQIREAVSNNQGRNKLKEIWGENPSEQGEDPESTPLNEKEINENEKDEFPRSSENGKRNSVVY